MQDPNEDTEWNDLLRRKGILPTKEAAITEESLTEIVDDTIRERHDLSSEQRLEKFNLDQLAEVEDDEDEEIILLYREKRLAQLKTELASSKFGDVEEISGKDYVEKVNKAGNGVWVFLHLYKQGLPHCTLINQYLSQLAPKFPQVKFLKSISNTCIPNFPDTNLPTIFAYYEGQMKRQFVGSHELGGERLKCDELEWMLSRTGAFASELEEDPRPQRAKDVLSRELDDW